MFNFYRRTPQINNTRPIKLVFVGDGSTGKSTLYEKCVTHKVDYQFNSEYVASDNVHFHVLSFNTNYGIIKCILEDTPGQKKFDDVRYAHLAGADAVICMCDITKKETCDNAKNWIEYVKNTNNNNSKQPYVLVMENKIDLVENTSMHNMSHVRKAQLQSLYGNQNNIDHIRVSVRDSTNLKKAFEMILNAYYDVNDIIIDAKTTSVKLK